MITSPQQRITQYTEQGWWGQQTLHELLSIAANKTPQHLAVADQPNRELLTASPSQTLSYRQLQATSDYLAAQLIQQGISCGDIVVVQLPNIVELVVLYYAISKIGAIISPVPIQYGSYELHEINQQLKPKCFVTIDQFKHLTPAKTASQFMEKGMQVLSFGRDVPSNIGRLDFTVKQDATAVTQINEANNTISICWTSGTTGTPKGVPRSHNMWLAVAHTVLSSRDYHQGDRLLNPFPLVNMASIGSFLYPSAMLGCSLFLHHPLDGELFLQQLQQEKITFTIAPPALLNQLAKSKSLWDSFDFAALDSVGSGSAPLAPWMIKTFSDSYGVNVINYYGSNEGITLLATPETVPDAQQRAKMFPIPTKNAADGHRAKIIDTTTEKEICEPGVPGELVFAGPTVFDGYYDSDNSDVFTADGFFRTGDLVEICGADANYYQIVGRCKDIINRGGMKISPSELDRLLEGHPDLKEVAVCGYPDEKLGEKICACVVPVDPKKPPALQDIANFLSNQHIAKYKLPEKVAIFEQLPRNPMGKVQRFKLQESIV